MSCRLERARVPRTIVIASPHGDRRHNWARLAEGEGTPTSPVGRTLGCALMERAGSCPPLDRADLAIYDSGSAFQSFRGRLPLS